MKLLEQQIKNYELQNKSLETDIGKKSKIKRRKTNVMENEKAQTSINEQAMIQNDVLLIRVQRTSKCHVIKSKKIP